MKPVYPNVTPELKKIRESLEELSKSVSEIKSVLVKEEPVHQIESMYPWHSTNTSIAGYDEEQ